MAGTENVVPWPLGFAEIDNDGGAGGSRGPVALIENIVPLVSQFPEIIDRLSQHTGSFSTRDATVGLDSLAGMDSLVAEIIDGLSQHSGSGRDDQLERGVGGLVGLTAETKIVVLWLTVPTENVDDGPSPHSGSLNAGVAADLLDFSGARGALGGVGGVDDDLSSHSGSVNIRVAPA